MHVMMPSPSKLSRFDLNGAAQWNNLERGRGVFNLS